MNLHSDLKFEESSELQQLLDNEIRKYIDFRYYRRFYLDNSSTLDDAVEDFLARGWEAGHNLNPIIHTEFVRSYYAEQVKSLSDFIELIDRPIFPNALCSKVVRPLTLCEDVQNEHNNYSHLNHYFSFDVEAYSLVQHDVAENPHFQSIIYHLFFVGLSQNRLRKFGYLKDLHLEWGASDLDCLISQKEPFHLSSFYHNAFFLSNIFEPSYYRKKYNLNLDKKHELLEHFCSEGWCENYDPNPYIHIKFIKAFYKLSSSGSGFDEFIRLIKNKFIPNALIRKPVDFFELSKCVDSFDISQQSKLFAIDIERFTRDRYSVVRQAKMSALKHLYLFGLEENILSRNGFFKKFFLPRFSGIDDYEFLSSQEEPLEFALSVSDKFNAVEAKGNQLLDNLLIGVVLYCNSLDEIKRLLTSILNNLCSQFSTVEIVFYDNSPDQNRFNLLDIDQSKFGDLNVKVIHDPDNCGFSVAHNRMMEMCFEKSDFLYLGLNPDGYLLPQSLERAHKFLTHKKQPFLCEMNTEPVAHPKWYDPRTGLTDWVSGVAFFIDQAAFNLLRGFDKNFPMYCEDVDLSFRAYGCGVNLYVTPFFGFYHDTTDRIYGTAQNSWRSVRSLIGEWYLCLKWGNVQRVLDLEKLMISRGIDFSTLPERPEIVSVIDDLVYDLVRSPRYSRSLY